MSLTAAEAERLFESGGDGNLRKLIELAEAMWSTNDADLTPEHAEVARYARVAAYQRMKDGTDDWATINLWQQRHVAAGSISGNTRSLSLSLQQYFVLLGQNGHIDAAYAVLDAIESIAKTSTVDAPPTEALIERILAERRALLLRMEGRSRESVKAYDQAHKLTDDGTRGEAKVRGGLELAKWFAGGSAEDAVTAFTRLVADSVQWDDVHKNATKNLEAAKAGDRSASVPFDLL